MFGVHEFGSNERILLGRRFTIVSFARYKIVNVATRWATFKSEDKVHRESKHGAHHEYRSSISLLAINYFTILLADIIISKSNHLIPLRSDYAKNSFVRFKLTIYSIVYALSQIIIPRALVNFLSLAKSPSLFENTKPPPPLRSIPLPRKTNLPGIQFPHSPLLFVQPTPYKVSRFPSSYIRSRLERKRERKGDHG